MSRKLYVFISVVLLMSFIMAACAPAATPTAVVEEEPVATTAPAEPEPAAPTEPPAPKFTEAPELAEMVKAGTLPPVEERLPETPMVVVADEVGVYGGTWRLGGRGGGDDAGKIRMFGYETLLRWNKDWSGVEPNLAESWEVNADATEYTFHLRKGLKWSDGEPFTSADIEFWYGLLGDTDLNIGVPTWMKAGGELGKFTKVDDYTFKFTFLEPFGLFESFVASIDARGMTGLPAHWAKEFHPKYTSDQAALDKAVADGGFTAWTDLWNQRVCQGNACGGGSFWTVANRPTMYAWMNLEPVVANGAQEVYARNPYYWKVDQNGQQYPYIDKLVYTIFQDNSAMLLKATNGEIDMQMRHFNVLENKAVLYDNMEQGNYHLFTLKDAANNSMVIQFNMTHQDPALREVFQNKDFRVGMSYAINRQEVINTVFVTQGKPFQPAVQEGSPFYNEQLATQYTEYDVDKANAALDKVLPDKDADGMRTFADGKPFKFVVEVAENVRKSEVDTANMLAKYWKAVGVNVEIKPEDRALFYTRKGLNQPDATIWQGESGYNPVLDPRYYFPYSGESNFAEAWQAWYNGQASVADGGIAEEPPAEIKAFYDKYEEVKSAVGFENQVTAMNELLQMSADTFFVIGISTPPNLYGIVANNMHNVPDEMINSFAFPTPAPYNTFTFFFK
ncbi:MAG: ABC transporter substrate-binding protein [Chloroflexi bacterium HGW-Chloroflexi-6]|nr:MAG: ABC transporter substrate-binding protein [Chloroflexi bacterium HGW-Chloroflexi-6]